MDACNKQILEAFEHRMDIASRIGDVKRSLGLRVTDPRRERQILSAIADQASPEFKSYATVLFSLLMEVSSAYQEHRMRPTSPLRERIEQALETTPKLFPQFASVACQGVDGAYSQLAAEKIFKRPNITFYRNFEGVFQAVESGTCEYGVLPIENSSAGTVNAVYDLMMQHNFRIVRSVRLKIDHCLLAKPGTKLSDIKEIYSHEQAISQCGRFLQSLPGQKIIMKGNHDYWWSTANKMNAYLKAEGFDTLHILHNNSYSVEGYAICGTRGWLFDVGEPHDEKVMNREIGRLRMSLDAAEPGLEKLVFLHYPPVYTGTSAPEIVATLKEYGIRTCYYGHLHGNAIRYAVQGEVDGIRYKLVSADGLRFCPYRIN